ncbi:MAG TPA: DUF3617 family protein [Caulobacteraceae bacterium]|nr:DUF3617 family protein [Caulobacteraceae bacterium]
MRRTSFAFAVISVAFAALPALAENPILPGFWESDNHSDLIISQHSVSRKCITPSQVETYLAGPANNHYTCVYDRREIGGGSVKLGGQCVDNNGLKMDVAIAGTYTPESFHLKAQLHTRFASLPIAGSASIDAHRLSAECPAPDQPKPAATPAAAPPPGPPSGN